MLALTRIVAIALNTYREAVRARLLLGVFALSLATCAYSLVIATLSLGNEARVVADLGALSFSLYGVIVAIILGSTSLYRELEYKTIFPILSRPIRRWEYLFGKYLGAVLTIFVFIAVECAAVLSMLAVETGQAAWKITTLGVGSIGALGIAWWRAPTQVRIFVVIPWAITVAVLAWVMSVTSPVERQLVTASAVLGICEVGIVTAVATLFASFSSPFLTAAFTGMVFVIGRSADTLAHIPKRVFGSSVSAIGRGLARVVPNLHVYVPPRPLLLGEVAGQPVWGYVAWAALHAFFYATLLLVGGALAFQRRDFS
jgi:ABC-type transport system involved in multi-copper enzyme maturation permease subunit